MRIVFTSYTSCPEFNEPAAWLQRINAYTGILEALALKHEVISIEQINFSGKLVRKGVCYHFLKHKNNFFPFSLHQHIKKLSPDIIFVHGFIFPAQIMQLKWQLGNGVKIIVQNHAEKPFSGWRKLLQKKADKCVDYYLFTSLEMGQDWLQHKIISDQHKIKEVMEASSPFFRTDRNKALKTTRAQGSPVFLWVGRLDANKDPLTVVKAFIQFSKQVPLARLYMIYQKEDLLTEVRSLVCSNETARESIVLVGRIPHHLLQAWYNSADFIISGSHYEGSGVAVCEAMSCGCIPIVTNIPSFRKMTGNGQCGLLYEPGSQEQLLSALLETRNRLLDQEREKTIEQFYKELSFEAIASKMNETIEQSLN